MTARPPTPSLFPMFADLRDRDVLVVGGGMVARRKVSALLDSGARVTVGAPELDPELARWAREGRITHRSGRFEPYWLDRVWLAIAATDEASTNDAVAAAGEARRVWVNVVDQAALSTFQVPARIERGPLQLAISSGGAAPMLARALRERLERQLDPSLGVLAEFLSSHRRRIRARFTHMGARRRFFDQLLSGPLPDLLRRGRLDEATHTLEQALAGGDTGTRGSVVLVGAGPGDPGLLTLRALRVLNEADVILHDRLVGAGVLALARRDAELVEVGKQAGNHHATQDQIHALMLEHARAGRRVVRLKGGDPFVFGRGGEELQFLRGHGIDYEVVPGITAALACAAYAGIPLTHRDHAQSVRLLTAHCSGSRDALDWKALAADRQTLAIYMGVAGLEHFSARLVAHGRARSTPVAIIENGSLPQQRVIATTLASAANAARTHAVESPALLIIGEVAALAGQLHWFGVPPRAGPAPSADIPRAA